ncbi:hypothetical protein QYF61_006967 [Mycteria americana]|uniref:Uncharacterized protein n=1 Tax=Mycteria americana TaxID=33587 RepID=A0AAN7N121_MYCAM|nr:hypothetical protein QYF61_006967 [Mycteria americana]
MASSGDHSFSSHFPGLVEHQDSKDFWLCIAIWPAAPGTLPVLLTGPQAGSDALQSKWAVGPWSDSTLAVLMPSSVLGTPVSPPESWAATIQLSCMRESPGQGIWSPFTISSGRGHMQMRAESSPHSPKCLPVPSPPEPTENQAQQQAMMRGFNAGGTTEYRTATTRSRDGEEMEGGFRKATMPVLTSRETTASPEDLHIGQHNENKTPKSKDKTGDKKPSLSEVGTCTGELEDLGDFTEELVHSIALAEGYGKCIGRVQHSIEKPTAPGSCCHVDTSSSAQEGPVVQGFADGHGTDHGFGDSGRDGAQVKNRELEEEEVHGGVEAVVAGYGGDDEAVAQEGSQVDAQEEPEVQELQLPRVCKCQEEELGDGAAVGHLLPSGHGGLLKKFSCPTWAIILKVRNPQHFYRET